MCVCVCSGVGEASEHMRVCMLHLLGKLNLIFLCCRPIPYDSMKEGTQVR